MLSLVWFKRDLRVADHPALTAAAARGRVLPVYIVEPELWAQPDASARQWEFVAECLADLRCDLAALGQPLLIRVGDAVEVLARLQAKAGFSRIFSHEETGNGWTYARDRRVAAWARAQGVEWLELPQSGVVRRLAGRDGWAARRNDFMAQPLLTPPALAPVAEGSGAIPGARSLKLPDDRCTFRQKGGRAQGLRLLDSFLEQRGQNYRSAMSSPLSAERACSRLSPYLAFGALSAREVAQATESARPLWRGQPGWGPSLRSFEARIAWRDHFIQKLEDEPALEHRALHPAMEDLRPAADPAHLAAWQRGETGLPFVDACMRYLHATGWLNFRMRAMLVSVAAYHLWLDWRATGPYLARQFTDYEPGIHWSQMQMQSGTTGINAIRLYNPVKQGLDQDPSGSFIRRWVPELAPVPDAFLHEPWKWPAARDLLRARYPEPVIDPVAAAREAREKVWARRRAAGFADEAARVARKHASRKGKPMQRSKPRSDSAQMALDL
ncbi:deoxyribodipyrimidine photo-lyase [Pararhodobacter sp.]|uniref:deoxyribodipyrimidine photo-lyase n=1 Tax=Pararhodobacter sp. TaxID=2127056 RepID=UPI002FDD41DC